MLRQNPRARHVRQVPDAAAGSAQPPSRVAQGRLTDALRDRADVYRADATIDLTLVDVLVRMDQLEAAAKTLDDHRASLRAMAQDLQVVVADAAVEREAERVYDTFLRHRGTHPLRPGGLRRRVMALTGAAAVFVALLLPSTRISPRTMLASIEDRVTHDEIAEARSRLDAARSTAAAVRADQERPSRSAPETLRDPAVRKQVRAILAADPPGESAAPSSSTAPVRVLSRVRATRERAADARRSQGEDRESNSGSADPQERDPAPVIPLRARERAPEAPGALVSDGDEVDADQSGASAQTGPSALPTD